MEQKKKRVRPSLTQMRALQAELAKAKEDYRLQLIADKHLSEELEAVKLKLKKTTEQLYEVGMKRGSVVKVSEGYRREEVEILQDKLDKCEKELESQIDGTSNLVKDCDIWRDKYRELKAKFDEQVEGTSRLVADCDAWREKYRKLAKKYDELNCRHQKLKIDADNAEYELDRSITASAYNALKKKYDDVVEESASMSAELRILRNQRDDLIPKSTYEELESKNATLESSNKCMEKELERVRKANHSLNELNDERLTQIQELRSRGFWARMFNRQ